ncbi:MAG: hypothetical protein GEV03_10860 [Streptosporangiales bacterium]|nr:hypothetical protein [Streptosporangiales bacterium]
MLTDEQLDHYREHGYVVIPCPFERTDYELLMQLAVENRDLSNSDGVRLSRLDPRYTVADTHDREKTYFVRPVLPSPATTGHPFSSLASGAASPRARRRAWK